LRLEYAQKFLWIIELPITVFDVMQRCIEEKGFDAIRRVIFREEVHGVDKSGVDTATVVLPIWISLIQTLR